MGNDQTDWFCFHFHFHFKPPEKIYCSVAQRLSDKQKCILCYASWLSVSMCKNWIKVKEHKTHHKSERVQNQMQYLKLQNCEMADDWIKVMLLKMLKQWKIKTGKLSGQIIFKILCCGLVFYHQIFFKLVACQLFSSRQFLIINISAIHIVHAKARMHWTIFWQTMRTE